MPENQIKADNEDASGEPASQDGEDGAEHWTSLERIRTKVNTIVRMVLNVSKKPTWEAGGSD